jgi:hypothetical protein
MKGKRRRRKKKGSEGKGFLFSLLHNPFLKKKMKERKGDRKEGERNN